VNFSRESAWFDLKQSNKAEKYTKKHTKDNNKKKSTYSERRKKISNLRANSNEEEQRVL